MKKVVISVNFGVTSESAPFLHVINSTTYVGKPLEKSSERWVEECINEVDGPNSARVD